MDTYYIEIHNADGYQRGTVGLCSSSLRPTSIQVACEVVPGGRELQAASAIKAAQQLGATFLERNGIYLSWL